MVRSAIVILALTLGLGGCGEPVRGVGEDAKAAKAQAHEAAQAAEAAAKRVDELSRTAIEQAPPPAGDPERHE
jgi:predicted small secreted protein